METEVFTSSIDGKDLWSALSLSEGLRRSPKFQLALQTGESEVRMLHDKYKEASDAFHRASKAGEQFADSIGCLSNYLVSLVKPSLALPVECACVADIYILIQTLSNFSNLVTDLSTQLTQPERLLSHADSKLEDLYHLRKVFARHSEQWESACIKAASVPRRSFSDAEEADRTLSEASSAFTFSTDSYLSSLRTTLRPVRLSTVLRSTLTTFEIQHSFAQELMKIFNPTDQNNISACLKRLSVALTQYESDAVSQQSKTPTPIANGQQRTTTTTVHHEGYLLKRSRKKRWRMWVRRWFCVTNNRLLYCSAIDADSLCLIWKVLESDLRLCTAKIVRAASEGTNGGGESYQASALTSTSAERRFTFELISPSGKVHHLQAETAESLEQWVAVLRSGLLIKSEHGEKMSLLDLESTVRIREQSISSENVSKRLSDSQYDSLRSQGGARLLDELPKNRFCADCLSADVSWASTNLGVTLCTDCASFHRSIGVHISKVRSLVLDNWEPELLEVMQNLGNNIVSTIFESELEHLGSSAPKRPEPGKGSEVNQKLRREWIESKWVRHELVRSFLSSPFEEDTRMWLSNLYFMWLTQVKLHHHRHHHNAGRGTSNNRNVSSSTYLSNSPKRALLFSGKFNHLPIVDRRRGSTVLGGVCSARTQTTLETLFAHVEILRSSVNFGNSSARNSPRQPPVVDVVRPAVTPHPSPEELAGRLVLVAGARLGCSSLIQAALAVGATPNLYPRAANWARFYRLPVDGDPLGAHTPPLISAVVSGRMAACELLLANGANIDAVDADGRTALHHACNLQRLHLVCLLLRRRADQTIKDKDERSPLDVAVDTAHADIVTLLRLQSLNNEFKTSDAGGIDDTAVEVFRDFTSRAYHLEWDSEEEDYYDVKQHQTS